MTFASNSCVVGKESGTLNNESMLNAFLKSESTETGDVCTFCSTTGWALTGEAGWRKAIATVSSS